MIYLDHAATTPLHPVVRDAMLPLLAETFGNPSSLYKQGQDAHMQLNAARKTIAQILTCSMEEIIFTSGATESIHTFIRGIAQAHPEKKHIITSKIEHSASLNACAYLEQQGYQVTYLTPHADGTISLDMVENAITDHTLLVSLLYVHNELGCINPISEIGIFLEEKNISFHVDAVQTGGLFPLSVDTLHCSGLSLSGHKLQGPKGIGILFVRKGVEIAPLIPGNQEFGLRGGTQHVAGAVGMAKALEIAHMERELRYTTLQHQRKYFLHRLEELLQDWHVHEASVQHPGILSLTIGGISAQTLLIRLDLDQIAISTGSACSSQNRAPSHVLTGIGLSEEDAQSTIRMSFDSTITTEELDKVATLLTYHVNSIRHMNITY